MEEGIFSLTLYLHRPDAGKENNNLFDNEEVAVLCMKLGETFPIHGKMSNVNGGKKT